MAKIDAFFRLMKSHHASDLHMLAGCPPCLRIRGDIEPIKYPALTNDELLEMLSEIAPEQKLRIFEETGDIDFAYEIESQGRFRANLFRQADGIGAVFRQIPATVLTIDELGLPNITRRFAMMEKGLVLVTGPTGSGKSTTLAAIIDHANQNRRDHILTIEDPIEFRHRRKSCLINHREVGIHTKTFASALRGALREDPDIIMVGELRDLETISLALEAASTGHLVLATLHTPNATKTVDRMIDVFPSNAQEQVRSTLADSLKGVISQCLLKRADTDGRVAALEILVGTPAASHLIREGKSMQLPNVIQTGRKLGMCTLEDAIEELLRAKKISPEDAFEASMNKERFARYLKEIPQEWAEVLSKKGKSDRDSKWTGNYARG